MSVELNLTGGKIYYETAGKLGCPNVLFLHGWGGSTDSFKGVFNNFSKDYFVINLDFYGFGRSDTPIVPLTLWDYTESVLALLEHLGIENTHIIAHSFGGRVAIDIASRRPDLVNKLILVDSAGVKPRRGIKYWFKVFVYKFLKFLSKIFKKIDLSRYGSADWRALSPVMKATFKNIVNFDLTPQLSKITSSTLIIWGENDKDTPLYMARKINKLIKNSTLVIFKNAGHFSYIDKYAQFLAVADRFLEG